MEQAATEIIRPGISDDELARRGFGSVVLGMGVTAAGMPDDWRWAAVMAHARARALARAGWSVGDWVPEREAPLATRQPGLRGWTWEPIALTSTLLDHVYTLRHDTGRTVYVSEPYALNAEAIHVLEVLGARRWAVTVSADQALWFPGRTVAIWVYR